MTKKIFKHDFPHELLLTTRKETKLRNSFSNQLATDIKLSKTQVSKIIYSGGFLGALLSWSYCGHSITTCLCRCEFYDWTCFRLCRIIKYKMVDVFI